MHSFLFRTTDMPVLVNFAIKSKNHYVRSYENIWNRLVPSTECCKVIIEDLRAEFHISQVDVIFSCWYQLVEFLGLIRPSHKVFAQAYLEQLASVIFQCDDFVYIVVYSFFPLHSGQVEIHSFCNYHSFIKCCLIWNSPMFILNAIAIDSYENHVMCVFTRNKYVMWVSSYVIYWLNDITLKIHFLKSFLK